MTIAISEEHEALADAVRRWLDAHCPPATARALLDMPEEVLQPVWKELAAQGWLGIHLSERSGGQGYGQFELAIVLEQCGRAMVPGPVLPTALVAAVLSAATDVQRSPAGAEAVARMLVPLVSGTGAAAVALGAGHLDGVADEEGEVGTVRVSGRLRPVLGAQVASVALVPVRVADHPDHLLWCVLDVGSGAGSLTARPLESLDATRRVGVLDADPPIDVAIDRQLHATDTAQVAQLALALCAAELTGVARWCLETASEYAKVRRQFGRPIGQFQAVKHRLADMLVRTEQVAAVAWDAALSLDSALPEPVPPGTPEAARPGTAARDECALAAATAGAVVPDAVVEVAKDCIQILGGIGFTWEHDAHLYLKRALATRQLLSGVAGLVGTSARDTSAGDTIARDTSAGDEYQSGNETEGSGEIGLGGASTTDGFDRAVFALARRGVRRPLVADLPAEAERVRSEIHDLVSGIAALGPGDQRAALVDAGLVNPHWPRPYGRDASSVEQLVIDEELDAGGVVRPHIGVGAWALPVIIAFGSGEQKERWVRPTLLGEITWCQLFSEPGAGSDLASLSTRAVRADGGWVLTGQKVWTSMAQVSKWAICLARTDPSVAKHEGITYFIVDMATSGLDIRPLRELTGDAMFNEVFLDDVFVPDDCVVGSPGEGWKIARATLASERVSISSGATFGVGVESLLRVVDRHPELRTIDTDRRLGALLAEAESLRLLSHRASLRTLAGAETAATTSVRKLLGAEHEQRVQEEGLSLYGPEGAALDGSAGRWAAGFLVTRCLTIAGGTSEVQRNVIAERILGQPRDPEPGE